MQIKLGKPFRRKRDRVFVLPYSTEPGKWRQKQMPAEVATRRDAEAWAASWASEMIARGGEITTKKPVGGATPRQLIEKWLDLREKAMRVGKLAPATVADSESHMRLHVLPTFGDMPIVAIDVPQLRAWVRTLRDKLSVSRCRNVHSSFANFVDDCMAEGWVSLGTNLVRHKGVSKELPERSSNDETLVIPLDYVEAVLRSEIVPPERRTRYAVAFATGARDGEIAGLRMSDVELDESPPRMHIRRSVAVKGPKGYATEKSTKTKGSVRTVPLHPVAVAFLRAWIEGGWELYVGRAPKSGDFVLPRRDGKPARPSSAKLFRRDLASVGKPTEVRGKSADLKAARATFVTWLAEAGVEEGVRQRLVGHVQSTVAGRHYTARELARLHDAVLMLPLGFVGAPGFVGAQETATKQIPLLPPAPSVDAAIGGNPRQHAASLPPTAHNGGEFLNRWSQVRFLPGAPRKQGERERFARRLCGAATKFPTKPPTKAVPERGLALPGEFEERFWRLAELAAALRTPMRAGGAA